MQECRQIENNKLQKIASKKMLLINLLLMRLLVTLEAFWSRDSYEKRLPPYE